MPKSPAELHTDVIIVGAGGHGRVVADLLLAGAAASGIVPIGFVDDRAAGAMMVLGLPVLGTPDHLPGLHHDAIVVAIGDNATRETRSLQLEREGERIISARHPFSSVGHGVEIGHGTMTSPGAVITPGVRIGRGVIVNTNATIDHDSTVGDFAHVSSGATVGAGVSIGARTLIGLGATVLSGCRIGADTIVGAGAVVVEDLPDHVVAVGVPARVVRANT